MAKAKRNEKEIEATARELPTEPPQEAIDLIKSRQKSTKLIYRAGWWRDPITGLKEKTALIHCTACERDYNLEHVPFSLGCSKGYGMRSDPFGFLDPADNESKGSYQACICPNCGATATAIHIGKIKNKTTIDKNAFMTLHNIRGHLVLLSWILFKECDKEGRIYYDTKLYEGIMLIGGMPIRLTGYHTGFFYNTSWDAFWQVRPVFRDNIDRWEKEEIILFDQKTFEQTDSAKSALDVFIKKGGHNLRIAAYLQLWCKYPQIENLVRSGFSRYVSKMIDAATDQTGYGYQKKETFYISKIPEYINVKKKKPSEMLGIDKEDFDLVNRYPVKTLSFYAFIKRTQKVKLTAEQLKLAEDLGLDDLQKLFKKPVQKGFQPPIVKTLNYLKKVECPKKNQVRVTPSYLQDYWNMLLQIQNGLPYELLFPKDIREAHDRAVLRVKEKTDQVINQKIEAFANSLDWLTFTDEETGLFIRVCHNQEELIKEGKFLNHCVGTYAKQFSERKTCILFIRRIKEPEIPFFTLEYKNQRVAQNRGKKNCDRTKEVREFEAKWLDYIKNYKETKKNEKPSNRSKAEHRAGA